jgi:hypothetical protein
VSCLFSGYCVAVGNDIGPVGQQLSFGELSLGANQWRLLSTLNLSVDTNALTGVSCAWSGVFAGSCQAVGYELAETSFLPQTQVWNGQDWSYEAPGNTTANSSSFLNGVSCNTYPGCTAVGYEQTIGSPGTGSTLAERFSGGSSPHALSLTGHGDVLALLRNPRTIELLVFKLGPREHLLGAVPLGHHPKGRSLIHWNLHVAGQRLAPGSYLAELVAALGHGATSAGPIVKFTLRHNPQEHSQVHEVSATCPVAKAASQAC